MVSALRNSLLNHGFKKLLETMNPRELRMMLSGYHDRTWSRLMADRVRRSQPSRKTWTDVGGCQQSAVAKLQ